MQPQHSLFRAFLLLEQVLVGCFALSLLDHGCMAFPLTLAGKVSLHVTLFPVFALGISPAAGLRA